MYSNIDHAFLVWVQCLLRNSETGKCNNIVYTANPTFASLFEWQGDCSQKRLFDDGIKHIVSAIIASNKNWRLMHHSTIGQYLVSLYADDLRKRKFIPFDDFEWHVIRNLSSIVASGDKLFHPFLRKIVEEELKHYLSDVDGFILNNLDMRVFFKLECILRIFRLLVSVGAHQDLEESSLVAVYIPLFNLLEQIGNAEIIDGRRMTAFNMDIVPTYFDFSALDISNMLALRFAWIEKFVVSASTLFLSGTFQVALIMTKSRFDQCTGMLSSRLWQIQFLGLALIVSQLKCVNVPEPNKKQSVESDDPSKGQKSRKDDNKGDGKRVGRSSSSTDIKGRGKFGSVQPSKAAGADINSKSAGKGSLRSAVSSNVVWIDELCKGGQFRTLCWFLMSSKLLIRVKAAELITIVLDFYEAQLSSGNNFVGLTELCSCFIEQGLVVVLEHISTGIEVIPIRIDGSSEQSGRIEEPHCSHLIFPEETCRRLASKLLDSIAIGLEASTFIQNRIANALLHSGNSKLRVNIFASLVCLCSRQAGGSERLGSALWAIKSSKRDDLSFGVALKGGELFKSMISQLCNHENMSEFKSILSVVISTMQSVWTLSLSASSPIAETSSHGRVKKDVYVEQNGQYVKMRCPDLSILSKHSMTLADYIYGSAKGDYLGSDMVTLTGDKDDWEEVFSHMTVFSRIDTSLKKFPLSPRQRFFRLARRYDIKLLRRVYADHLANLLTHDNFVEIFALVLDPIDENGSNVSDPQRLDFYLCLLCLKYFYENADAMISKRFILRTADILAIFYQCLHILFFS